MVDSEARSEFDQAFRRRLRRVREAKGLELQDVADHVGIPKNTYAKYETRSMIPIAYLKAVCDRLGTDPWHLMTNESPPSEDHFDRAHTIFLMVLTLLADRKVTDMDEVEVETWAAFLAGCFADDRLNEKDQLKQHLQSSIINLESVRRARQGKR